jgi:hypothetical protein
MTELRREVAAVLGSADLDVPARQDRLAELRREYAGCLRAHGALLTAYGRAARGKTIPQAEAEAAELLAAASIWGATRDDLAALLAVMYPGVLLGASGPGFPLLTVPLEDWDYRPTIGRR